MSNRVPRSNPRSLISSQQSKRDFNVSFLYSTQNALGSSKLHVFNKISLNGQRHIHFIQFKQSEQQLQRALKKDMDKSDIKSPGRDYKIISKFQDGKITVRVVCDDFSEQIYSWETDIASLSALSEILPNFFENLEDFYDHIQDKNNSRVDLQTGVMSILLKTTIKNKESLSEIARIKMQPGKIADVRSMNLENIIDVCNSDEVLSNKMIKSFFKIISTKVISSFQESKLNEILDPFMNKFKFIGEESQKIERRLGGLLSEIAELKDQTSRQIINVSLETKTYYGELKDYIETVKEGIDREIIRYENKNEVKSFEFQDKLEKIVRQLKDETTGIAKMKQQIIAMDQQIYDIERELYRKNQEGFKMEEKSDNFIDTNQPYFSHFRLEGSNKITKKVQTGTYTILVGKNSFEKKTKFSVKILKADAPIYVGIIEGKHRWQQYCQENDKRAWYSTGGIIFDGEIQRKALLKFELGMIIQVFVNTKNNTITWKIGEKANTIEYSALKNKGYEWFPCIWVAVNGDAIELKKNQ